MDMTLEMLAKLDIGHPPGMEPLDKKQAQTLRYRQGHESTAASAKP